MRGKGSREAEWDHGETTQAKLASLVIAELNKPDSEMRKVLSSTLSKDINDKNTEIGMAVSTLMLSSVEDGFKDKIGDLFTGKVTLTKRLYKQTIYIYAPTGHKIIFYAYVNDLPEGEKVLLYG